MGYLDERTRTGRSWEAGGKQYSIYLDMRAKNAVLAFLGIFSPA